jgi:predicted sulfurtransferase
MKYKRVVDEEYWRLGLEKAGLEAGGDVKATKYVLEKMVTRKSNGHYEIQGATTIDAKQTKALQDQGAIIFDMRGTGGWRNGHLKSAIQARTKISDFNEKNLLKFASKDQIVIFYCSGFT